MHGIHKIYCEPLFSEPSQLNDPFYCLLTRTHQINVKHLKRYNLLLVVEQLM